MQPYLMLTRPVNAATAGAAVLLGYFALGPIPWPRALADAVILALLAAGGNVHNDICDYQVDLVNRPERPLPSGKARLRIAMTFYWSLWTVAIGLAVLRGPLVFFSAIGIALLLLAYNRSLKRKVLVGNLAVAMLCTLPLAIPLLERPWNARLWPLLAFAFLLTLAREVIKDMEDVEGDRKSGMHTLPIALGIPTARRTAGLLLVAVIALLPLPVLQGAFGALFLAMAALLAGIPALLAIRALLGNALRRSQGLAKIAMMGGMLATLTALLAR